MYGARYTLVRLGCGWTTLEQKEKMTVNREINFDNIEALSGACDLAAVYLDDDTVASFSRDGNIVMVNHWFKPRYVRNATVVTVSEENWLNFGKIDRLYLKTPPRLDLVKVNASEDYSELYSIIVGKYLPTMSVIKADYVIWRILANEPFPYFMSIHQKYKFLKKHRIHVIITRKTSSHTWTSASMTALQEIGGRSQQV